MQKVIGVRFRTAGKVYFFNPKELFIKKGDHVIVETARGLEYGTVVSGVQEMEDEKIAQPLKPVLRVATAYDERQQAENVEKEKEAFQICLEKIRKHGLKMKLIDTEYTFDNNKILFYFTADGRIDFRELEKDLAAVLKQGLNCVRSVSGMRQRFWEVSAFAEDLCAVIHFYRSLHLFPSKWQRNRICL